MICVTREMERDWKMGGRDGRGSAYKGGSASAVALGDGETPTRSRATHTRTPQLAGPRSGQEGSRKRPPRLAVWAHLGKTEAG